MARPPEVLPYGNMSGIALSTTLSTRTDRKVYIVWMAIVWVAIVGGFAIDFARYLHESPPPPTILHVHAAVYVAWLALVSVQIFWSKPAIFGFTCDWVGRPPLYLPRWFRWALQRRWSTRCGRSTILITRRNSLHWNSRKCSPFPAFIYHGLARAKKSSGAQTLNDPVRGGNFRCGLRTDMAEWNKTHSPRPVRLVASVFLGHYLDLDRHAGLGLVQAQTRHALRFLGSGP